MRFKLDVPLISVIIPSYNHEKFLEESIRSVWNQDYVNIELIVIDDGSRDGSAELLNQLHKISPITMHVISRANQGLCKTLNEGIRNANGEFIAVIASDDRMLESKISCLYDIIRNNLKLSFVYADFYYINESGLRLKKSPHERNHNPDDKFLSLLLLESFYHVSSALFRKSALVQVGYFDESLSFEDYDMLLKLLLIGDASYIDAPVFEYRIMDNESSLSRNLAVITPSYIKTFNKYSKIYCDKENKSLWFKIYLCSRRDAQVGQLNYNLIGKRMGGLKNVLSVIYWCTRSICLTPVNKTAWKLLLRAVPKFVYSLIFSK